jgi:hypothetical protein
LTNASGSIPSSVVVPMIVMCGNSSGPPVRLHHAVLHDRVEDFRLRGGAAAAALHDRLLVDLLDAQDRRRRYICVRSSSSVS